MNQALTLLLHTRHVARGVHDVHDGNVVRVARTDKTCAFIGGIRVDTPREVHRVVGYEADGFAVDTAEGTNEVLGVVGLDFNELFIITKLDQKVHHVVASVGVIRQKLVEVRIIQLIVRRCREGWHRIKRGSGQVIQQVTHKLEGLFLRIHNGRNIARLLLLARATKLSGRNVLTSNLTDHVRAGDIHLRLPIHSDDKVRGHRSVHRATGRLAQHDGDLRAPARQRQLTARNLRIHGQRRHRVLNTRATRILDANHWAADLDGKLHHFDHLAAKGHANGTAIDGLVVGVDGNGAAVDTPVARHNTVGIHRVFIAWGAGQGADLDEGAFVQKRRNALARRGNACVITLLAGALRARVLCLV